MKNLQPLLFLFFSIFLISCGLDNARIHNEAFVADTHNDVLLRSLTGRDILTDLPESHSDLPKFRDGGVDLQVFSIWVSPSEFKGRYYDRANIMITQLEYLCSRVPDQWAIPFNYQDIVYNDQKAILSCMIGVEGGHVIENDMAKLNALYERGMRYLGVTWNNSNEWATSAKDETEKRDSLEFIGLTEFGKDVIRRCNKLGVMVDISHAGEQTVSDILKITKKPVIASHSSVYSLCPQFRNLKDSQLLAIKENGGVVFVNFYPGFIDSTFTRKEKELKESHKHILDSLATIYDPNTDAHWYKVNELLNPFYKRIVPDLDDVIDHIDYIVNLIGIDHVGIGADWDGVEALPRDIEHIGKMPAITEKLVHRGYTVRDVKKILGGNFKRVFREITG